MVFDELDAASKLVMKGLLFRSVDGLSDVARAVFKRILKLDAEFCFDPHNLPAISHAEQVKAPVRRSTDGSRKGREERERDGQMGTVT